MITVITPTADQPTGIALLEDYMQRQTVQPAEWIVADDGEQHATLTMGQVHLRRRREYSGGRSLAENLIAALKVASGDQVLIMEHDDWYSPDHIATQIAHDGEAVGCGKARYYHVGRRAYSVLRARGASLCNTLVRGRGIELLRQAAYRCAMSGQISIDRVLWAGAAGTVHHTDTVVGIKGLPGRPGLGMGHRADGFTRDHEMAILREWTGDDAAIYAKLH